MHWGALLALVSLLVGAGMISPADRLEISVLGALAIDPHAIELVSPVVTPNMFEVDSNRVLYRAMLRLRDRGDEVDPVLLLSFLRESGQLDLAGGTEYVAALVDAVPTSTKVEQHARNLRDRHRRARIAQAAAEIAESAASADDPTEILERATARLALEQRFDDGGFPLPRSIAEGLADEEAPEGWIFPGLIPEAGNILQIGYPKSMKSIGYFDAAVAAALNGRWLNRFQATRAHRVGIVLMEGRRRFAERMIERIARGKGHTADDLTGLVHLWHRPPLRLTDARAMKGLAERCEELELDLLILDAFGYAAGPGTNTNNDQEVLDQLQAFSALRDTVPGLATWLTHHARKEKEDKTGARLTDLIRGSGAFGQWYDTGLVFFRKDEQTPVSIRTEFRERTAIPSFSFIAEDEHPASIASGGMAGGWFKLTASERSADQLVKDEKAAALAPLVIDFLRANPGAGSAEIRDGVTGDNTLIGVALESLKAQNKIVVEAGGRGRKTRHSLAGGYLAEPC